MDKEDVESWGGSCTTRWDAVFASAAELTSLQLSQPQPEYIRVSLILFNESAHVAFTRLPLVDVPQGLELARTGIIPAGSFSA